MRLCDARGPSRAIASSDQKCSYDVLTNFSRSCQEVVRAFVGGCKRCPMHLGRPTVCALFGGGGRVTRSSRVREEPASIDHSYTRSVHASPACWVVGLPAVDAGCCGSATSKPSAPYWVRIADATRRRIAGGDHEYRPPIGWWSPAEHDVSRWRTGNDRGQLGNVARRDAG
jgi:hypothetical protein